MKVFADMHHGGLYHSFQILFEDRFGWELYRPIGKEWFTEGYWRLGVPYGSAGMSTVNQFLGLRDEIYVPPDGTRPLNEVRQKKDGYYVIKAPVRDHRAVTLEQFKNMKFDYIIPSFLLHYDTFTELRDEHQPQAKVICQMGNNWLGSANPRYVKNLMASIGPTKVPKGIQNTIFYHQEFDTRMFSYQPYEESDKKYIRSFIHAYPTASHYRKDWKTFKKLSKLLPSFTFESYGAGCPDGVAKGDREVAPLIQESRFIFHLKTGGDGYGHIIHNAFACGRPPLVRRSQYEGQLAEMLMEDGVTCLDLDNGGLKQSADRIADFSMTEKYEKMSKAAHDRFREVVDFEKEAKEIEEFLERAV